MASKHSERQCGLHCVGRQHKGSLAMHSWQVFSSKFCQIEGAGGKAHWLISAVREDCLAALLDVREVHQHRGRPLAAVASVDLCIAQTSAQISDTNVDSLDTRQLGTAD